MHGVGIIASDSQSHLHGHHSLDSITETVAMAGLPARRCCKDPLGGGPFRSERGSENGLPRQAPVLTSRGRADFLFFYLFYLPSSLLRARQQNVYQSNKKFGLKSPKINT